jgi:hypothetical protein
MNREEAADFNKRLSLDRKESESFLGPPAICEDKESQKRGVERSDERDLHMKDADIGPSLLDDIPPAGLREIGSGMALRELFVLHLIPSHRARCIANKESDAISETGDCRWDPAIEMLVIDSGYWRCIDS